MPALPDVPKVLKIILKFLDVASKVAIVTDHVKYTGTAPTGAQLDDLAGAVITAFDNHLKSQMSTQWTLKSCEIIDLSSPSAASAEHFHDIVGTASGYLPADACTVITQAIGRRYRGGHPKAFYPIGTQTNLADPNNWNSTYITDVATRFTAFRTDEFAAVWSGGGTLSPVMVSYYQGFTNVTYPNGRVASIPTRRSSPLVDDVLGESPRSEVGSQRRRQSVGG